MNATTGMANDVATFLTMIFAKAGGAPTLRTDAKIDALTLKVCLKLIAMGANPTAFNLMDFKPLK
jgi:hypothetical protein